MRCHAETTRSVFFSCSVCSLLSPLAPATFVERTKTWIQNPDFSYQAWSQDSSPLHLPHWLRSIPFSLRVLIPGYKIWFATFVFLSKTWIQNLDSLSYLFFVTHFLRAICVHHLCRCSMSLIVWGSLVVFCLHVFGRSSDGVVFISLGLPVELHTQALVPNYRSGYSICEWTDPQNRSVQKHANPIVFHGMEYSVRTCLSTTTPKLLVWICYYRLEFCRCPIAVTRDFLRTTRYLN